MHPRKAGKLGELGCVRDKKEIPASEARPSCGAYAAEVAWLGLDRGALRLGKRTVPPVSFGCVFVLA